MCICDMTDENEFYFWDEMWNEEKNNKKNEKKTTKNMAWKQELLCNGGNTYFWEALHPSKPITKKVKNHLW